MPHAAVLVLFNLAAARFVEDQMPFPVIRKGTAANPEMPSNGCLKKNQSQRIPIGNSTQRRRRFIEHIWSQY